MKVGVDVKKRQLGGEGWGGEEGRAKKKKTDLPEEI